MHPPAASVPVWRVTALGYVRLDPPLVGELDVLLTLVVSQVDGDIFETVFAILRLVDEFVDEIPKYRLFCAGASNFTRHPHNVFVRVVPRSDKLDQFQPLFLSEVGQIFGAKLHHHFLGCGMGFSHVGCVSESQRLAFCRGLNSLTKSRAGH